MSNFSISITLGHRLTQRLELVLFSVIMVCISHILQGCVGTQAATEAMMKFDHIGEGWCGIGNGNEKKGSAISTVGVFQQNGYGIIDLDVDGWRMTNNNDGSEKMRWTVPGDNTCTGIEVMDQRGFGIVDVQLVFSDGSKSGWATGNTNGVLRSITENKTCFDIEGIEQQGYGIVDLRLVFSEGPKSDWVTGNTNGALRARKPTAFVHCSEFSKDTKDMCENECKVRPECGAYTFTEGLSYPDINCFIHASFMSEFRATEAVIDPEKDNTMTHQCYQKDIEAFERDRPIFFHFCGL